MQVKELIRSLWPLLAVLIAGVLVAAVIPKKGKGTKEVPRARKPLTDREQAMYFKLQSALPEHVVLAQVALSALLEAKSVATRNTFDRKIADFVVCSKAFEVLAIVELDDASHKTKRAKDAERDHLLQKAGYKTLRFQNVADAADIKAAFAKAIAKDGAALP